MDEIGKWVRSNLNQNYANEEVVSKSNNPPYPVIYSAATYLKYIEDETHLSWMTVTKPREFYLMGDFLILQNWDVITSSPL